MAYRAESAAEVQPRPGRFAALFRWSLETRLVRAGMRYHFGKAALFSGGVTWSGLLSLTAVVTLLVNVTRLFLGDNPRVFADAVAAVNAVIPGLIDDGMNDGVIDPNALILGSFWNPVTIASILVALWTALSVMAGLRRSIRAMFGLGGAPLPIWVGKTRDLLGFVGLVAGGITSMVLSTAFVAFTRPVLDWLGVQSQVTATLLPIGAVLVSGLLDALVFVMLFRVTAGVRVVTRDMVAGALMGAVFTGVLRMLGTSFLGVVDDPVLASFAALASLAVLVSAAVRLTLFTAAWTANPPSVPFFLAPETIRVDESPNYVTRSAPHTLEWPYHAVTGSLLPTDPSTGEVMDVAGFAPRPGARRRARRRESAPS